MKKTMKRNALLSSVAMLIVSAIVLTSATYAWFSAAKEASINNFSVSVQSAQGLQMSVNGATGTYKNTFDSRDVEDSSLGNAIPKILSPVSTRNGLEFVGGSINATDKVVLSSVTDGFYKFNLWLKAFNNATVTLDGSTFTAPAAAAQAMKIAFTVEGGNTYFLQFDNATKTWNGTSATGTVAQSAGIVSTDTTSITSVTKTTPVISLLANTAVKITVSVWLEGNDSTCVLPSSIPGSDISFSLKFVDTSVQA